MIKDDLGERMKGYENISRIYLTRRIPVIIRIDGKAFHTFTKGFVKPFDDLLIEAMQKTMQYLCENVQGCVLGYTQSDEITLVLTDYAQRDTDAWFGYNIQKMTSISSSLATLAFNRFMTQLVNEANVGEKQKTSYIKAINKGATFDSRVFSIPKEEVVNCLIWRQLDATRNSIESVAQSQFSTKELNKVSCKEAQNMLLTLRNINWNDFSTTKKRGSCCIKKEFTFPKTEEHEEYKRNKWVIDNDIPIFTQNKEYITSLL